MGADIGYSISCPAVKEKKHSPGIAPGFVGGVFDKFFRYTAPIERFWTFDRPIPAVILGDRIAHRLPVRLVHRVAAGIFAALGLATLLGVAEGLGL